eukprot:TRINITY_DN17872_c0_g1_i1.p1 TRINITY_DN17872_c0_g1~~TRINITY_DN17872_c0_g1_i1.p1  ORF type:complete len:440 (-),score=30.64 TRINITY_DN17872_c0_g1_i1:48-1367(-)
MINLDQRWPFLLTFWILVIFVPIISTQEFAPWPSINHDSLNSNRANNNTPIISDQTTVTLSKKYSWDGNPIYILNNQTLVTGGSQTSNMKSIYFMNVEDLTVVSTISLPLYYCGKDQFNSAEMNGASSDGKILFFSQVCQLGESNNITIFGYSWGNKTILWQHSIVVENTYQPFYFIEYNSLDESLTIGIYYLEYFSTNTTNLDSKTGDLRWVSVNDQQALRILVTSFPNNLVFSATSPLSVSIISIDGYTGQPVWIYNLQNDANFNYAALYAVSNSDQVAIALQTGYLICLDSSNGALMWRSQFNPNYQFNDDVQLVIGSGNQFMLYQPQMLGTITISVFDFAKGFVRNINAPSEVGTIRYIVTVGDYAIVVGTQSNTDMGGWWKINTSVDNPSFELISLQNFTVALSPLVIGYDGSIYGIDDSASYALYRFSNNTMI